MQEQAERTLAPDLTPSPLPMAQITIYTGPRGGHLEGDEVLARTEAGGPPRRRQRQPSWPCWPGSCLASGATPTIPDRFFQIYEISPVVLIEVSHFLSSIPGPGAGAATSGLRARRTGPGGPRSGTLLVAARWLCSRLAWRGAGPGAFAALCCSFHGRDRGCRAWRTPGWLTRPYNFSLFLRNRYGLF